MAFKTKFKEVLLSQKNFSSTSVRAIKEIYAEQNGVEQKDIKALDFKKCLAFLQAQEGAMSPNGNVIN